MKINLIKTYYWKDVASWEATLQAKMRYFAIKVISMIPNFKQKMNTVVKVRQKIMSKYLIDPIRVNINFQS